MKTSMCACASVLAALVPLVLCGTGCTLVGFGIGSAADSGLPDRTNVESWRLDEVKTGTDVSIVLRDGSIYNGEFKGVVRDSLSDYQARYGEYLAGRTRFSRLPRVGDSVWVVLTTRERRRVEVVAYDYNGIYFSMRQGYQFLVRYTQIDTLNSGDTVWSGYALSLAVTDEQTPVLGSIVLEGPSGDERREYPLSDIQQISYKTSKRGAISGALVGFAVDAVVIVAILVSQEKEKAVCPRSTYPAGRVTPAPSCTVMMEIGCLRFGDVQRGDLPGASTDRLG